MEPPSDLKDIILTTAQFVVKMGGMASVFENEIKNRNANNSKFDFLKPDNVFHSFYKKQIQDFLPSSSIPISTESLQSIDIHEEKPSLVDIVSSLSLTDKINNMLQKKLRNTNNKTELIPDPVFTVRPPENASAVDIDIIKLTAQFVARNGRQFLAGLSAREARNSQFDFLKPSHAYFAYFQLLVDAYAQVLIPSSEMLTQIKSFNENSSLILQRINGHVELTKMQQRQKEEKMKGEEEERLAFASIDWHDFVVVKTIDFLDSEEDMLPEPLHSMDDIRRVMKVQDQAMHQTIPIDNVPSQSVSVEEEEMDMDVEELESDLKAAGILEKPQYSEEYAIPAKINPLQDRSLKYQRCPICGEDIPLEQIAEHMRIELLDPRWREYEKARLSKHRESNIADEDEIKANLDRLMERKRKMMVTMSQDEEEIDFHKLVQETTPIIKPPSNPPPPPLPPPNPSPKPVYVPPPITNPVPEIKTSFVSLPPPSASLPIPIIPPPPSVSFNITQVDDMINKKIKIDNGLLSEEDFILQHPEPISLTIIIPIDNNVQELHFSADPSQKINELKTFILQQTGLPINKQKIKMVDGTFIKEQLSFAYYNMLSGTTLTLQTKERGRKK